MVASLSRQRQRSYLVIETSLRIACLHLANAKKLSSVHTRQRTLSYLRARLPDHFGIDTRVAHPSTIPMDPFSFTFISAQMSAQNSMLVGAVSLGT
jgi:hypothetical protein